MRNIFNYEYKKLNQLSKYLPLTLIVSQILSLLFFIPIFQFIPGETNNQSVNTFILPFVTSLTFCIGTVYSSYFMNKFLLIYYIGNAKEKTYTLPLGRSDMLRQKISAFYYRFVVAFFVFIGLVNIIFIISADVFSLMDKIEVVPDILNSFSYVLITAVLAITIVLTAIVMGLRQQSTNVNLITSIILVTILSNVIARVGEMAIVFQLIVLVCLMVFNFLIIKYIQNKVQFDDVI